MKDTGGWTGKLKQIMQGLLSGTKDVSKFGGQPKDIGSQWELTSCNAENKLEVSNKESKETGQEDTEFLPRNANLDWGGNGNEKKQISEVFTHK